MSMLHPPRFELQAQEGNRLRLASSTGAAIEVDIIRVLVLPHGDLRGPATWSIAPGGDDTPVTGRDRRDLSGFSLPAFELHADADTLRLQTSKIRLTIALAGGFCTWEIRRAGQWQAVLHDRATRRSGRCIATTIWAWPLPIR